MKSEKIKDKKQVLGKGRMSLVAGLFLFTGLCLSFIISSLSYTLAGTSEGQTIETVVHKSPLVWRADGAGDYLLSELTVNSVYELTEAIKAKGPIETLTAAWQFKGEVNLEVSTNNGQDYTPAAYGVPLDYRGQVTGDQIRCRATLGADSELTEIKIVYTDIEGEGGTFGSPELSGFKFRKSIVIARKDSEEAVSEGDLFNYQISISVCQSTNTCAPGAQVGCEGNVKADFSDIRFTAADGETILPYYLESVTGESPDKTAAFWVKIPQIPSEDFPIYMYYGNSEAESLSDGESVFDFFEDFSEADLDLEKWEIIRGAAAISGRQLELDGSKILSKTYRIKDGIIEYRAKASTGNGIRFIIRTTKEESFPEATNQIAYSSVYEGGEHGLFIDNIVKVNAAKTIIAGVFYNYRIIAKGEDLNFKRYSDLSTLTADNFEAEVSYNDEDGLKQGYIGLETGEGSVAYYDWVRVRKIAESEPYISVSADEEEVSLAEFLDTILAENGNVVIADSVERIPDSGQYITAPIFTTCNISAITPTIKVTSHTLTGTGKSYPNGHRQVTSDEIRIDISADGGLSWKEACESGRAYSAPFDFTVGKKLLLRANFSSNTHDAILNTQYEIEQIKLDYSLAPIVTSGNISTYGATGDQGVYILGDAIVVEWDNSVEGDNNPDGFSVSCNLESFGGDVQAKMFDENKNNIYICRYELSQGIKTTANIFVTATNLCGMTTRDGHILSVNTIGEASEGEEEAAEEAETKEKEDKSLGKRYTIKFGEDEAEIGDFETEDFKPHAKLKRWGEECSLSVEFPEEHIPRKNKTVGKKTDKIEWDSPQIGSRFYKKGRREIIKQNAAKKGSTFILNENGGLEFELVLKEIPDSNVFSFPIKSKGLKFYYQGQLTQAEIDEGVVRPDEVVGSYAVYHDSKKDGKYGTGKAFHIYRPKIIDNNGDWIWGGMEIVVAPHSAEGIGQSVEEGRGEIIIAVDKDWLENAAYPVIVDPEFGYMTIGSSAIPMTNVARGSIFTAYEMDLNSIIAYLENTNDSVTYTAKYAIYEDSDLSLVGQAVEIAVPPLGKGWYEGSYSPSLSLQAIDYALVAIANSNDILMFFDEGDPNQGVSEARDYAQPWPGTADFTYDNNLYSIYDAESVDDVAPTAAITYTPTDGIVKSGDLLTITVTFNEDMVEALVPQISISGVDTLAADMIRTSATVYTYVYAVGAGDGTATVALSTGADLAGNVVTSAPTSGATFTVDNTVPTIPAANIDVNNNVQPNTITIQAAENLDSTMAETVGNWLIRDNSGVITYNIASASLSNDTVTLTLAIPNGADNATYISNAQIDAGIKVIFSSSNITDVAGNVFADATVTESSGSHTKDTVAPTTTFGSLSESGTGTDYTYIIGQTVYFSEGMGITDTQITITVTGADSGHDGAQKMVFGAFGGDSAVNDLSSSYSRSYNLSSADNSGTITVAAYDYAGNADITPVSITMIKDTTAPIGYTLSLIADTDSNSNGFDPSIGYDDDTTIDFSVSGATDAASGLAVDLYAYKMDLDSYADWVSATTIQYTGQPEGNRTVRVKVKDNVGNEGSEESVAVVIDITTPATASISSPAKTSYISLDAIPSVFRGDLGDNIGGSGVGINQAVFYIRKLSGGINYYWDGTDWDATTEQWLATTHSVADSNDTSLWNDNIVFPVWMDKETYFIRVKAVDKAGNIFRGSESPFIYDSSIADVSTDVSAVSSLVSDVNTSVSIEAVDTRTAITTAQESMEDEISAAAMATQTEVTTTSTEIVTLVGSGDLKTGDTLASIIVRGAASSILNQESYIKENGTLTVRYKTDTGLTPVISVYDGNNTLRINEATMPEAALGSGIYGYSVKFIWGKNEHTIICKEEAKGTLDGINIDVISTDLEQIGAAATTTMGQLAGIDTSSLENVGANLDSVINAISPIIKSVEGLNSMSGRIKDMTTNTIDAIYDQLSLAFDKLKEISSGQGVKIEEIYEVSEAQALNVGYIRNKTQEIRALIELQQDMSERINDEPIVTIWMESTITEDFEAVDAESNNLKIKNRGPIGETGDLKDDVIEKKENSINSKMREKEVGLQEDEPSLPLFKPEKGKVAK